MLMFSTLRNRLQSSTIRRAYWAVANRETLLASQQEEAFYRELLVGLSRHDLIFDVGANVGAKADVFLRLGARVVAIEPDDTNQVLLRDRFLRYRLRPCPIVLVPKAVSAQTGTEKMWIDGPGSAVNTLNRKWADHLKENSENFKFQNYGLDFSLTKSVETVTIEDLIKLYGVPYFIKIDVEGYELSVLRGMQRPVPFLSFEVNLRAFRGEGIECVRVLRDLKSDSYFNYTPDCCSGLVLKEWMRPDEFCSLLESCSDETVEVFWKSNALQDARK